MQNCIEVSHCSCSDLITLKKGCKLHGWTGCFHSSFLCRVIRAFAVDLFLFCARGMVAPVAIVMGAFLLRWSRFCLVDSERQWHAPTRTEMFLPDVSPLASSLAFQINIWVGGGLCAQYRISLGNRRHSDRRSRFGFSRQGSVDAGHRH